MHIPVVKHSLKYNPSFDGIRGIAILGVLLFHIWPEYFKYGYLGVDLFFVLSGYLITNIIYSKCENNSFSFKEFYRNRIRRIFPAVIIVLVVTLILGYVFLLPLEYKDLGHHVKSSAYFYENFRLLKEVGYWDKAAQLKPLLHFWSLSVEEQFYIVWPLLIVAICRLRLNLVYSLFALFLFSLVLKFSLNIDQFYHPLARFWELILGAVLFALSRKYKYEILRNNKILSFYPLVFLGLISFPLYLWHYVIISFMYILGINVQLYGWVIIAVSVILAFIVYRYVEIYARSQTSYKFASVLFAVMLSVGLAGHYIYMHNGLPKRSNLIHNSDWEKQFIREPSKNAEGLKIVKSVLGYVPKNNYIKATSYDLTKKYILIMGDSHAHTSYPGFAEEFKKYGYETLLLANSSCPPYPGGAMGRDLKEAKICQQKIESQYEFIKKFKDHIEKIIFLTRGPKYMYGLGYGMIDGGNNEPYLKNKLITYFVDKKNWHQKEQFLANIEKLFKLFNNSKIKLYYVIENPELGFSPQNCIERPFGLSKRECKLPLSAYLKRSGEYREFVFNLAKKYKNVTILDPKGLYCDSNYCYAVKNGKMLYADDDHHSVDGSVMQAKYFIKKIMN